MKTKNLPKMIITMMLTWLTFYLPLVITFYDLIWAFLSLDEFRKAQPPVLYLLILVFSVALALIVNTVIWSIWSTFLNHKVSSKLAKRSTFLWQRRRPPGICRRSPSTRFFISYSFFDLLVQWQHPPESSWRGTIRKISSLPRVKKSEYREVGEYQFVWQAPQYAVPSGVRVHDFSHVVSIHYNGGLFNYFWAHAELDSFLVDDDLYVVWIIWVFLGWYLVTSKELDELSDMYEYLVIDFSFILLATLPPVTAIYLEMTRPHDQRTRSNISTIVILLADLLTYFIIFFIYYHYGP